MTNKNSNPKSSCLSLDQFIAYAENKMSPHECVIVEDHLKSCDFCSDALEGLSTFSDKRRAREIVQSLNKDIHRRFVRKEQEWGKYYAVAAVLVLVVFSILYFFSGESVNKRLFSEFFQPYPNTVPIVRGKEPTDNLELAMSHYERGEYRRTLKIMDEIIEADGGNLTIWFYAGIVCLKLDKNERAITHLKNVMNAKDSMNSNRAAWYLALAFIKNNQLNRARTLLNEIVLKKGEYSEASKDLLGRLKEINGT